MVGAAVFAEVARVGEGQETVRTPERFLAGVQATVGVTDALQLEPFSAPITQEWFQVAVDAPSMIAQVFRNLKTAAAHPTQVFFGPVCQHVLLESSSVEEALVACGADKGARAHIVLCGGMFVEVATQVEPFTTVGACEGKRFVVLHAMAVETAISAEPRSTQFADERLVLLLHPVLFEILVVVEGRVAHTALKFLLALTVSLVYVDAQSGPVFKGQRAEFTEKVVVGAVGPQVFFQALYALGAYGAHSCVRRYELAKALIKGYCSVMSFVDKCQELCCDFLARLFWLL